MSSHFRLKPALAALAALATSAASRSATAQERGPTVNVELNQPGTSLRRVVDYGTGQSWWYGQRIVCSAPCEASVPADATYQIVGDGIATSSQFQLPARSDVLLRVRPGNASAHDGATVLVIAGAVVAVLGGLTLVGAASSAHSGTVEDGLIVTGVGAALLAVGLPIMLSNATTVHFE